MRKQTVMTAMKYWDALKVIPTIKLLPEKMVEITITADDGGVQVFTVTRRHLRRLKHKYKTTIANLIEKPVAGDWCYVAPVKKDLPPAEPEEYHAPNTFWTGKDGRLTSNIKPEPKIGDADYVWTEPSE